LDIFLDRLLVITAGTEIGQGLTTKIQSMVAVTLGCDFEKIFVHAASTEAIRSC